MVHAASRNVAATLAPQIIRSLQSKWPNLVNKPRLHAPTTSQQRGLQSRWFIGSVLAGSEERPIFLTVRPQLHFALPLGIDNTSVKAGKNSAQYVVDLVVGDKTTTYTLTQNVPALVQQLLSGGGAGLSQ